MFKKDTRRGLALGAAFSLIASLFVAAPAAQADEAGVVVKPFAGESYTMLITEDFIVKTRLGLNVSATRIENLKYIIEKPAGLNLSISNTVSATALSGAFPNASDSTFSSLAASATVSSAIQPSGASNTGLNQLRVQLWSASAITSLSSAVTVKITAFLDTDPDGALDKVNEKYETVEVKFVPWSALGASVTLATPVKDATTVKATAAVSGVNFDQLGGDFNIGFTNTYITSAGNSTVSADLDSFVATGAMSASTAVSASAPVDSSVSATLYYDVDGDGAVAAGEALVVSKKGVSTATIDDVSISAVVGANIRNTGDGTAGSRVNATFELKAWAYTGSTVVAAKVPTFTVTTSTNVLSETNYVVVNGTKFTKGADIAGKEFTLTAGADGKGTITIGTFGFDGTSDTITLVASSDNDDVTFTVTQEAITWSVSRTAGNYITSQTGTDVVAEFSVADQFGEASKLNDQQIVFSLAGSGFTSSQKVVAVSGGKASVTFTPSPSTLTASFTITPNLQYLSRTAGQYVDDTANETAVTVYRLSSLANSFSTKPATSYSASISYGAVMSWSAISAAVSLTGSAVVVSSPGVIFKYDSKTYSDTVTVEAGSAGAISFEATSRKAGNYTISFTAGAATASTILKVAAAAGTAGKNISFDTTAIAAGATKVITGTLTDENGNPVHTSGSAVIEVTYLASSGTAGIYIGSLPTETDADGKFSVTVFTGSNDKGFATITANYYKSGKADTAAKDVVTMAQTIAVGGATTAAEVVAKISVGSFTGRVVVYAKGYNGKTVSYRIAGKWGKMAVTKDLQSATSKVGSGRTIKVDVYVDGSLVKTETITTK